MIRFALAFLCLLPAAAFAQDRRPSHCIAIADAAPGIEYIQKASWQAPVPEFSVRISYVNHSMFLIQTVGGLSAVTDFNGYVGIPDFIPTIVTMNRAHSTHWTPSPDPRIPHILEGWDEERVEGADHYLDLGEMLVRNVTTDIRSGFGGSYPRGNSIFVFEVEGLCIGHLGHLHHIPNDEQFAALGRLDVVMAPVDGGMTLNLPDMIATIKRLKSSIVLPMHWFGTSSLEAFLVGMSDEFAVERVEGSSLEVSLRTLPDRPTVKVLMPSYLDFGSE